MGWRIFFYWKHERAPAHLSLCFVLATHAVQFVAQIKEHLMIFVSLLNRSRLVIWTILYVINMVNDQTSRKPPPDDFAPHFYFFFKAGETIFCFVTFEGSAVLAMIVLVPYSYLIIPQVLVRVGSRVFFSFFWKTGELRGGKSCTQVYTTRRTAVRWRWCAWPSHAGPRKRARTENRHERTARERAFWKEKKSYKNQALLNRRFFFFNLTSTY